ncbi:MAG: glycosyltransferase family A protein [Candidatus Heimdallarchaeota archaeon]
MSKQKVLVVISARNEEKYITDTITSLLTQTLPPEKIIIVDDGSTDQTVKVVRQFKEKKVVLLERKERVGAPSLLGTPLMALPFNIGFEYIQQKKIDYDYIMISGADCIYDRKYIETIVKRLEKNERVVIASGCQHGEEINRDHARGAGRIIKKQFWELYGAKYPFPSFLWESGIIFKAQMLGYEVKGYTDIGYHSQRVSSSNIDMIRYGRMLRAIGYPFLVVLGRAVRGIKRFGAKQAIRLIAGYLETPQQQFEADKEISEFLSKNYLKQKIRHFIK